MYYNKQGKKISINEWVKLFKTDRYKIVKQETLKDGRKISTVWLGLNHNTGEGEPLIFETMVFPGEGNYEDEDMERYSTLEEAIKGHEEMVKKYNE